jgi:Ca2+/H+ antiporter
MITCNGIVGLTLLVASLRHGTAVFNPEGTGAALATVATLATLSRYCRRSPRADRARSSPASS